MPERSANRFLLDALRLCRSDRLLVCFDKFGEAVADHIITAAMEVLQDGAGTYYFHAAEQEWSQRNGAIRFSLRNAIAQADALAFCITDADQYTTGRVKVLTDAVKHHLKIVHLPGVDEDLFLQALSTTDFISVHRNSQRLLQQLEHASKIHIETTAPDRKKHTLHLSVRGRDFHCCGGIAEPGEIMNLPTGEVYVAPAEYETNGSIALTGSTDYMVFSESDHVVLSFHDGLLDIAKSEFGASQKAQDVRRDFGDLNETSRTLGELGIGTNPGMKKLIGKEIVDEKMAGTIHIALGANIPFGGILPGTFHRDLIIRNASVFADGERVALPKGAE